MLHAIALLAAGFVCGATVAGMIAFYFFGVLHAYAVSIVDDHNLAIVRAHQVLKEGPDAEP